MDIEFEVEESVNPGYCLSYQTIFEELITE